MEMAFTAIRVLFLSNSLLLAACSNSETLPIYPAETLLLDNRNGIIFLHNQPFTGRLFERNEHGDTLACYGFYKGQEHGEWKKFYPGGHIAEQRFFNRGTKIGTLTHWWPNGNLQLQCNFLNGEYHGTFREWNAQGKLISELNYKNGYEDGPQKLFYDNGKVRSNYVIINGKRYGLLGTKNCVNVKDSIPF